MKSHSMRPGDFFASLGAALLCVFSQASAATLIWDPGGGGASDSAGAWLTAGDWWNGASNVNWTSGDDAIFGNSGTGGAVTLASPTTVGSLTFNTFTGSYTLGTIGQAITLTNGITMNAGAGAATIISPITLGAAQSWINNSSSLLTVGTDAVTNGGFLLTLGGTGDTTVSSAIGGTGGLTKTGNGTLTLSGANAYTGQTNITAGTLKLASASALGTVAGATVLTSGAVLDLGGFSTADPLAIIGSGISSTGALINSGSGVSTVSGALTLSGATTIGGTGQISFTTAAIGESGGTGYLLTKTGTGIAIFNGIAATRTGNTSIDQGTLRLIGATTVNPLGTSAGTIILNGGTLSLAGVAGALPQDVRLDQATNTIVTDSATAMSLRNLTFNTANTGLTLAPGPLVAINTAAGENFTGTITLAGNATITTINNGTGLETLTLGALADGAVARTITKEGGGSLIFNTAASSLVTSGMALTINRGFVTSSNATALGANTAVTVNNNATFTSSAAQTIASLSGAGLATSGTGILTIGDAQNLSSTFTGFFTNTTGLTKVGTGTLTLSGPNAGAGAVVVTAGTLRALDLTTTLGTGTMSLNGGTLGLRANSTQTWGVGISTVNATSTINVENNGSGINNVLSIGALNFTGSTGLNVTGANGYWLNTTTSTLTNANQAIDVASGVTFQMGGIVSGATFGITKNNTGTLILAGVNTYTGATTLNAGTLRGTAAASFGAAGAGLNLNGGSLELFANTATTFTNTNTTIGNSSSTTITSDILTGITGISGLGNGYSNAQPVGTPAITHTLGTLTMGTASVLNVNSQNFDGVGVTFGATTINGTAGINKSTINIGATDAQYTQLTLGALTMGAANVLDVNTSGSGTLLLGTASTTIANGATINVNGGTLRIGNATALGAAASTGAININNGATLEIAGVIPTSGNITLNTGSAIRGTGAASGFNNATANTLNIASGATVNIQTGISSIGFLAASTGDIFTLINGIRFAGDANVVVSGNGRILLNGAATNANGTWTQNSGILQLGNVNALGATVASSPITVNGGVLTTTTGLATVANAINLSGGALAGVVGATANDFSGQITLGNGTNSIIYLQDPTTATAGTKSFDLTGLVTGTTGNLLVTGLTSGTLGLTNSNNFEGNLTVTNAIVTLGKSAVTSSGTWQPTNTPTLTLNQGGQITIQNTVLNVADRIKDGIGINMIGGSINLTNSTGTPANAAETVGVVTLNGGFNSFNVTRTGTFNSDLTLTSLNSIAGTTSVAAFTGTATLGGGANQAHVFIADGINNAFLGPNYLASNATAVANEFAAYSTTANVGVLAISGSVANLVTAGTTDNVRLVANPTATISSKTVNSLNLFAASTVTMNNNAQVLTLTSGGLLSNTANTITQGAITAGASPLYINTVASTLLLNSFITGSAPTVGIVYSGAGTTTIGSGSLSGSAANTYTGSTTLNNGGLTLARAPGIIAVPGDLTVVSGILTLTNAEQIGDSSNVTINNLSNSGTFVLPAANLNETIGSLTLNSTAAASGVGAGTLILTSTGTNALTVTGGTIAAQLRFTGTSGGGIKFLSPAATEILAPTVATTGGPYQTNISGIVDLNSSSTTLTRTINVEDGPAMIDLLLSGALTASGGTTGITKTGAGTMRFGATSTYTGLTTLNDGILSFSAAGSLGLGGLTVAGGKAEFNIAAAVNSIPATLTIPGLSPNAITVTGGTLEFNNLAQTAGKLVYSGGTINAPMSAALTLQNPNSDQDILALSNGVTLRGNLTLGAAVVNNITTLGNSTVTLDGLLSLSGPRKFIVADGTAGVDLNVTSSIAGAGILWKTGAGTMQLSGGLASQNVNTGSVYVTEGALALNKNGVFGSGGGVGIGTGSLIIGATTGATAATVQLIQGEQIANASAVIINANGTLDLQGFSETIGAVTMNSSGAIGGTITGTSGTLYIGAVNMTGGTIGLTSGTVFLGGNVTATSNTNSAATLTGAINLGTVTRTFTVNPGLGSSTSDLTVSGVIAGNNIGLTKLGAGIMTLSGANTYTGLTTLTAGTLLLDSTGSISANSAVAIGSTMFGTVNPTLDITAGNKTIGSLTGGGVSAAFVAGVVNIGTRTLTVGSNETSPLAYAGAIIGSSGGLTKTGLGTLTLSNANFSSAFSGATIVNAGILSITGANALPFNTDVTVNNGGTFFLAGVSQTLESLQVNSGGTLNGTIGTLTINRDNSSTTIDGFLHGSFTLNKAGTGDVTITGNQNTYTGAIAVNQGSLILSGSGTLATTAAITINPGGTLSLDNSVANFTDRLAATTPMTLDGGIFEVKGMDVASSGEYLGTLTLNTGVSTINVVNGTGAGSSTVVAFNAAITRTAGTLNITSSGAGTLGTAGDAPRLMFLGTANNTVLPGVIVNGNSMAFYDQVLGVRSLGLGEETELNLAVNQAALPAPSNNLKFISSTASQLLPAARTINSLTIDSPGAGKSIDVVGADASTNILTVTTGNIILNGTDDFEIKRTSILPVNTAASGSITSANPLTFWVNNAATTLTVSAPISGAIALNKSGAGTLILSGANLYTGATILNEGTLQLGASNSLYSYTPSGVQTTRGAVSINNSTAILDIGGFNNTISTLSVISGSITNSGVGGSLTTTGDLTLGTATPVGGAYGSAPSISIGGTAGAGILNLGGNVIFGAINDPNGATIAGNLALGYDVIGPGASRVFSGATRTFTIGDSVAALATGNANPDLTVSAAVTGAGLGITKAGTGLMLLSGTNTYSGPTAITGQLNISNASALGDNNTLRLVSTAAASTLGVSGGFSYNANTVLSLNGTGRAVTEAADLAFPGALNNISGNNSFAGFVTLSAAGGATIKNSASGTTLTLSGEIINGATLLTSGLAVMGAGNVTLSGAINTMGGGALTYNSTNATPTNATLTLGGTTNNYYTGATTINAGAVTLNKTTDGTNAIGIGALIIGLAGGGPAATLSYGLGTAGNDQINDYTAVTLNQSGTINMNAVSDTFGSLASAAVYGSVIPIPGSPTAALVAGIPLVNGSINLGAGGATLTIGANNTATSFGGVISGTGNLVKIGTGVQTFTNSNTYVGTTTLTHGGITMGFNNVLGNTTDLMVNSPTGGLVFGGFSQSITGSLSGRGLINLGTGGILTFGNASNSSYEGIMSGAPLGTEGGLVKQGTGILTLTGANAFTTNFRINQGTVVGKDLNLSIGNAAPIWLNASNANTTLSLLANTTQAMGGTGSSINITGTGNNVLINVNNNTGASDVTGNVLTLGALNMGGQTLEISGGNGYGVRFGVATLTPETTSTFNVGSGLSLELSGAIANTNGALTKTGAGLMILSGANTQVGVTTLNGGTLRATLATSLGASPAANALTLTSGTLDLRNNATAAFARNTLVNGNSTINVDPLTGITGYAAAGAQPTGTPAVLHSLGALSIGANTLTVSTTTSIGALSSGVGAGLSFAGLTTLTGNAEFNVGTGAFLQLSQINGTAGAFGFTKSGAGILNLTGASSTTGGIAVNGGILRVSTSPVALGTSVTTIGASGTLEINAVAMTSGSITLDATGATLRGVGASGFTSLSNPISITAGQSVNIQTGTSNMGSAAFNTADVFTIGTAQYGPVVGTTVGGLNGGASNAIINVSGQGRVILAANNSTLDSSASWNLTSGTLQLGAATTNSNALGTNNAITISGTGVLSSGAIATTYTNPITSTGGNIAGGTAAVTATYVSATTLTLSSGTTNLLLGDASVLTSARSMNIGGQITGSGNLNVTGLTVTTPGTAALIGATASDFTGNLTITQGTLTLGANVASQSPGKWAPASGTPSITFNPGGVLTLDNRQANVSDRLADAITLSSTGGTLNFFNRTGVTGNETIGASTFVGGLNAVSNTTAGAAVSALTLTSLTRSAGATVTFTGTNLGTTGNTSRIIITPQTTTGFLGGGFISGTDFVKYDTTVNSTFALGVTPLVLGDYQTNTAEGTWATGQNLSRNTAGTTTLTADRTANAMKFITAASTVDVSGRVLTLESGGLLFGITASAISDGAAVAGSGLTAGTAANAELFIHNTVAAATISSRILDNVSGAVNLVYSGSAAANTLTLSGANANTYTGATYVNGGTLTLNKTAGVDALGTGAATNTLTIHSGTVSLSAANQIADGTNVTINGLGGLAYGNLNLGVNNETINSLTIHSIAGAVNNVANAAGSTLTLAGTGANVLIMTGGQINLTTATSNLALSGTSGGGINIVAPATALAPTTLTLAGPYQSIITGVAGSTFNLNNSATTLDRTFTVENGPAPIDLLVSTILTNTTGSNVTGIIKEGAGTMRISTAATYNGSTTINNGVLSLNIANATPATAKGSNAAGISATAGDNVVNVNGGALNFDIANAIGSGANLNVAGGTVNFNNFAQSIRGLRFTSGTINAPLSGALTLTPTTNNDYVLQMQGTNLTGNLAFNGGLTATNNNFNFTIQTLASATTAVIGGQLNFQTNTATGQGRIFDVALGTTISGIDLDVTASLSNTTAVNLIKTGAGTMRLSGGELSNNTWAGTTTVNEGMLILAKTGLVNSAAGGGVAILGALTIGDNTGGANADVVRLDANEQIANAVAVTINSSGLFNMNGNSETIAALNIGTTAANGGSVTNGGGATGSTLYTTGTITMNGGTINLDGSGTGGKLVLTGTAAINTTAGGTHGTNTITANSIILPSLLTVTLNDAVDVLNINGNISGYGIGLTKTGASGSVLVLNGNNTFTGATTITQGTLQLAGGNAISDDSAVTITDNAGAILDLNGTAETIGSLANATGTNAIVALGAGGALTTGADDSTTTYAGRITSTSGGTLTKVGIGTMTLSGALANTFTGLTTVTSGGLILAKTAGINAIAGDLSIGGITGTQTVILTNANQIANTSLVTVNASGIFNLGTGLTETISNLSGSGLVTANTAGSVLTLAPNSGNQTFSGIINATTPSFLSLSVAATGTSSLTLSGTQTNNYTGATTIGSSSGTFTLVLGKTGDTVSTLPGNIAINSGGKIQFAASSGANQLSNAFINNTQYPTNTITLAGTGILDLNGVSAVVNTLTGTLTGTALTGSLINSAVGAATLNLAGAAPVLTLDNTTPQLTNINLAWTNPLAIANAGGITTAGAGTGSTLTIASNINLNTTAAILTGTRVFNIADDAGAAVDVDLTGVISSSGGPTGITKIGISTLGLSGANTYTGATTLSGGGALVLNYGATDNNKIAGILSIGGGTLTLKGATGNHVEIVTSTSLNAGGAFLTRDGANTARLNMNVITRANSGTISFGDATIADTDTNNINSILGGWATIGNDWAVSVNTGAADTVITALATYTGALPSIGAGAAASNYTLTGSQLQTSTVAANTVKITNTANSQTLSLAGNNLTITSASATSLGGIMYAGGNDDLYSITGTTGRIASSAANQELIFAVQTGTLTVGAFVGASGSTGPVTKSGAGILAISSANNYTGATFVNQGVLSLQNNTAAGTTAGGIVVQNNASLELANSVAIGAEALTIVGSGVSNSGALRNVASNTSSYAGVVTLGLGGARINSDTSGLLTLTGGVVTSQSNNVTFGGAGNTTVSTVAISGAGGLVKDGAGTTTLTAVNTYTGATQVNQGILAVNGTSTINTSAVTINGGDFRYNSSTAYSNTLSFTSGTLSGTNWIGSLGGLTIGTGQIISPGNSPGTGTATTITTTWASGGTYVWEMNSALGSAGLDPGWDLVNGSGTLDITASLGVEFTIEVTSLTLGNAAGAVSDFDQTLGYNWMIANFATVNGFDATDFTVSTSGFANAYTGTFAVALGDAPGIGGDNSEIWLTYTAIPEPKAALLACLGVLLLLRRRR